MKERERMGKREKERERESVRERVRRGGEGQIQREESYGL